MKKILRILLFVLIGVIVIGTFVFLWKKSQPKQVIYEITTVESGNIENTTVATGKVSPRDEILIKPQISGIVSEVLKEAGDYVTVGDIIATVKVVPDVAQLNTAESTVSVARINLTQVETEYVRQKQLYEKGVIAKEEMDKSEADYKKALEELDKSKNSLDIIKTGISKKTAQYSNTQIRSTITGMILDVPVKAGNSVIQANTFNDGTTIATVANMNDMIFIGKIDETEVGRIHAGMPIKLSIGAIENQKFDATLEYVAPKGVEENGAILFEIKAAARIPDTVVVRAGYSANAEIVLSKAEKVLTIPESTITFSNDSAYVYVLKDSVDHKQAFDKKHIKIGLSDGIKVEVKEGLAKGEKIRGNEQQDKPKKEAGK
ncbi:HlyD family secretion protein [Dysgonomonas sp. PFB1-18]|uniref:efflux RND transporter periplasmic adaptor subunit n=1 Tax=unclassified Dysgonomonas TaxID=2630389 RepID=UPI0024757D15|nr:MULTISPECIES: efflux RND transporter periplasmic adaptor subunit [unclassified Dysgonomonas]MDH6308564.1 HlyD family secretion protein [Dysgonomonas sp. PF1-14]MDH6338065.1 HlyD family secretion protein [Dysgonomonas sp. PF1-16]MDH6379562.1 HlyD family secretion protein [Dysgonomonas sp. PFB1-18]MDH6396892.1 HlyD family secretion protein [Dysgonomonas sp. PF1-23]